jgi:uncharacterized protein (DUF1697 family)
MAKYIVLLRGINVSGKNVIKMAALKEALFYSGFEDVQTYIQSGNVILLSPEGIEAVKTKVYKLLQEKFSLDVEVFVFTMPQLQSALDKMPFPKDLPGNRVFITFLSEVPDTALVADLAALDHGAEVYYLDGNVLYFYLPDGMAKSKMNNNYFERKLGLAATGRNVNTVRKLLSMN